MGLKKVDPCQLLKDEDLLHYQSHLQEEKQSIVVKKKKEKKKHKYDDINRKSK
jgi:hypothetical protein